MTKPDEGYPKYHMPLEEANKLIEENIRILDCNTLEIQNSRTKLASCLAADPVVLRESAPIVKENSIKEKLGKIMHKLYDLEPSSVADKPLNVDLGVDLYQMENY